jgi:phage-related holin
MLLIFKMHVRYISNTCQFNIIHSIKFFDRGKLSPNVNRFLLFIFIFIFSVIDNVNPKGTIVTSAV